MVLESRRLVEELIKRNDILEELSPDDGDPLTLWCTVKQFRELALTIREDAIEGITTVLINWTNPDIVAPLETDRIGPLTFWTNVTQILYQGAIAVAAIKTFDN